MKKVNKPECVEARIFGGDIFETIDELNKIIKEQKGKHKSAAKRIPVECNRRFADDGGI